MAIVGHDPAFQAGVGDGQLRGAFGAFGECHDLLAELVVACDTAQVRQSPATDRSCLSRSIGPNAGKVRIASPPAARRRSRIQ